LWAWKGGGTVYTSCGVGGGVVKGGVVGGRGWLRGGGGRGNTNTGSDKILDHRLTGTATNLAATKSCYFSQTLFLSL
jgi:hypothetical protein